ncbi:glucose-6-phosphate isomerase [Halopseudomonas aestusnigri]|uniref:glucose-6-phosphate isomerase n=1 Tax=Halopseudomonas aestusnigri TaxID=857252 RepID=UPI001E5B02A0|nr:glucose-6-phosphate isomerase [Halopseudomonas aestusnigri]UGV31830.1 glucose-6-phosphate isomerase [Halopseudomonas aestusnigri]
MSSSLTHKPAWQALMQHAAELRSSHLAELFAADAGRFDSLHRAFGPLLFDFSKQRLDARTLPLLFDLAAEQGLAEHMSELFSGAAVNPSEGRAAMHWALRLPAEHGCVLAGEDINAQVQAQLQRMDDIVQKVRSGQWRGATGEAITDVVNIGVGGSDLGPLMVTEALTDSRPVNDSPLRVHFASTMDGSQVSQLLGGLNPHATLFIISSKSFSTIDTLSNAATARGWLERELGELPGLLACHFIGVSAAAERMTEWGIAPANQLALWEWVGGRFSLWSAIGLPIALSIGMAGFRELLAGAHAMDEHFRQAPWADNLPVLLGLIGIWNTNMLGINAHAVLPYDGRLKELPNYLEQLEMESNGKSVNLAGDTVDYATCPIVWGTIGPNAQHAFYQLLHQGTEPVTCDFIVPARRYREAQHSLAVAELRAQHELALANCLAQSRLLALGDAAVEDADTLPRNRRYRGNQPSSTLLLDELTPCSLGALIALYEHKVFVQSVIWEINPFDQWGVEMGKRIAVDALACIRGDIERLPGADASTAGLLARIMAGSA